VWIISVGGEWLADRQLARFRQDPSNKGKVCRQGLWRYSRHPNYFFEWVHWWAYVLIGIGGPWGWLTLFGPAVMLVFLLKITGVPPTEKRALQSRGEAYREYQRTTSVFFPWPPKQETAS
jgi:steroid 5-alpha reductase family enzyme